MHIPGTTLMHDLSIEHGLIDEAADLALDLYPHGSDAPPVRTATVGIEGCDLHLGDQAAQDITRAEPRASTPAKRLGAISRLFA